MQRVKQPSAKASRFNRRENSTPRRRLCHRRECFILRAMDGHRLPSDTRVYHVFSRPLGTKVNPDVEERYSRGNVPELTVKAITTPTRLLRIASSSLVQPKRGKRFTDMGYSERHILQARENQLNRDGPRKDIPSDKPHFLYSSCPSGHHTTTDENLPSSFQRSSIPPHLK